MPYVHATGRDPSIWEISPKPANRGDIALIAVALAREQGADFAFSAAPRSAFRELSGNQIPDLSRLEWLRNRYKCTQFVGEALIRAGFKMPTFRMNDGSVHFMNAELLPHQSQYFARITDLNAIQPGDLMIVDYAGRGENSAHAEIVLCAANQRLQTVGAHRDGAKIKDNSHLLSLLRYNQASKNWVLNDSKIYVLRPKSTVSDF